MAEPSSADFSESSANSADFKEKLEESISFFESNFTIKDMGGHLHTLGEDCETCGTTGGLKFAQRRLLALYLWAKERRMPIRIIILKARKEGLSTLVEALMLMEALKRGIDALVIAHDKDATQKIFEISERFYRTYPETKPDLAKCNVNELKFKDQEGHMQVLTAGNVYAGTALTPQFLHASESAKWPKGVQTATALWQSIAHLPDTCIIVECTANGFDPLFKPMWDEAAQNCEITWGGTNELPIPTVEVLNRENWNGYIPLFISVFDDPQYSNSFKYDGEKEWFSNSLVPEERDLQAKFHLSEEQLNAYRWLLKHKCRNDKNVRFQEYPYSPEVAFIYSGRPRFNVEILSSMPVDKPVRGILAPAARMSRKIVFHPEPEGEVYRWEEPVPGHSYVIGVDTSEGLIPSGTKNPDSTVAQVFDRTMGGVQVAKIYGQISEDILVEPLSLLCEYYNGAWCVIENNSTGKLVAVQMGEKYDKQRLYREHDEEDPKRRSKRIGFRTHGFNRRQWVGRLASLLNDRSIVLKDEKTVSEMVHFHITEGGRAEAATGYHDDHVSALWLVVVGFDSYPDRLKPYSPYNQTTTKPSRSYRYSQRKRRDDKPLRIY